MKNLLKIWVPVVLLAALLYAGCCTGGGGDATTYTVTYDANGADSGSVPVDSNNYEQGQTVTVQGNTGNLVKTDCTCCGWNTASDGSGDTCIEGGTFEMGSADVILYAQWEIIPGCQTTYTADGVSFIMAFVPGGITFPSDDGAGGPNYDDSTATVTEAYWIGETEVTYELWSKVYTWATHADRGVNVYTFANPGTQGKDGSQTDLHPVTTVNWRDVMVFYNAITEWYNAQNGTSYTCAYYTDPDYTTPIRDSSDGIYDSSVNLTDGGFDKPYIKALTNGNFDMVNCTATGFRLLTSMEYELAARYITDDGDNVLDQPGEYYPGDYASGATADYTNATETQAVAWYVDNSGDSTHEVKGLTANALGLYDMCGNVAEWCFDWVIVGSTRVNRGGSYNGGASSQRVGFVYIIAPYIEYRNVGFRLARTVE